MDVSENLIGDVAIVLSLLAAGWRLMRHMDGKIERLSDQMDDKIERLSDQMGEMRERMARMEGYLMAQRPPPAQADAERG